MILFEASCPSCSLHYETGALDLRCPACHRLPESARDARRFRVGALRAACLAVVTTIGAFLCLPR